MNCYLCNSTSHKKISKSVRDISNVSVLRCNNCGLVYLSSFDHIDNNFYENSSMRDSKQSIDQWRKETLSDDKRRYNYLKNVLTGKNVLDFGAGNGGFLSLAKEVANTVTAVELDKQSNEYFENHQISHYKTLNEIGELRKFDVITAFHVIEHLKDPVQFLNTISKFLAKGGSIYLEFPNSDDALLSLYNCKKFANFTYWGCHLMLFNENTIKQIIEKANLLCHDIKQVQRYPLSNHLYWLSCGLPGGHHKWSFINDEKINKEYEKTLSKEKICDTILVEVKSEDNSRY